MEWFARLVRYDGRGARVVSTTPLASAVIAGQNVVTPGWPSWHDDANRSYSPPKPYAARHPGRYAWLEYLSVVGTTHGATGLITPHYRRPGNARVSLCVFSR